MNGSRRAAARPAAIARFVLAALILVPALSGQSAATQAPAAPDNPPLAHLKAYIEAFNASARNHADLHRLPLC